MKTSAKTWVMAMILALLAAILSEHGKPEAQFLLLMSMAMLITAIITGRFGFTTGTCYGCNGAGYVK